MDSLLSDRCYYGANAAIGETLEIIPIILKNISFDIWKNQEFYHYLFICKILYGKTTARTITANRLSPANVAKHFQDHIVINSVNPPFEPSLGFKFRNIDSLKGRNIKKPQVERRT